jgi:hypothetical protein
MNNDDLKDFLVDCHVATGNLDNLVQSLVRSIQAGELETAHPHPDRELIKLLAEKIANLNHQIGDRL